MSCLTILSIIFSCAIIRSVDSKLSDGFVSGATLDSPESYMYDHLNFSIKDGSQICAFASVAEEGNRTILVFSIPPFQIKIVHRNLALMAEFYLNGNLSRAGMKIEFFLNEYFYVCIFPSLYYTKLTMYVEMNKRIQIFPGKNDTLDDEINKILSAVKLQKEEISSTLYVGDPMVQGSSFNGTVAYISWHLKKTRTSETYNFINAWKRDCSLLEFAEDLSTWLVNGSFTMVQVPFVKMYSRLEDLVVFNGTGVSGFDEAQNDFCRMLGGRFLELEEIKPIQQELLQKVESRCKNDEGDIFTTVWTKSNCELLELTTLKTINSCTPVHACFLCLIPDKRFIIISSEGSRMRNYLGSLTFIDINQTDSNPDYFMFKTDYPENGFISNITFKNGSWVAKFNGIQDSFSLSNSILPVGKKDWQSLIIKDKTQSYLLYNCDNRMACDDGSCFTYEEYCDGKMDCRDGTDEHRCEFPYQRLDSSLNLSRPIEVGYSVSIVDLQEIKASDTSLKMELKFSFKWKDQRLLFKTRHVNQFNGSELPFNPASSLYLAKCHSDFELRRRISDLSFWINQTKLPFHVYFRQLEMNSNFIMATKLPCEFDFLHFPFSKQACKLCVWHTSCQPFGCKFHMTEEAEKIQINVSKHRGDFLVKEITQKLQQNGSRLEIEIHMESVTSYYILTSFIPSVLMTLISYSTLYFSVDFFNERIMVSLTALLTLVLLLTDVSSSLIKTSYVKLIDVWFIVCIVFSVSIIIVNAVIHYLIWHRVETPSVGPEVAETMNAHTLNEPESHTQQNLEDTNDKEVPESQETQTLERTKNTLPKERLVNNVARVLPLLFLFTLFVTVRFPYWILGSRV